MALLCRVCDLLFLFERGRSEIGCTTDQYGLTEILLGHSTQHTNIHIQLHSFTWSRFIFPSLPVHILCETTDVHAAATQKNYDPMV